MKHLPLNKPLVVSSSISLIVLLCLLAVPSQPAHAQTLWTNLIKWSNGTAYGTAAHFGISNPDVSGGCADNFHRYLFADDVGSGETDGGELIVGEQVTPANCADPYCNITKSTQWAEFFAVGSTTNLQSPTPNACTAVPNGLINQDATFTIRGANGDGFGAYVEVNSCAVAPCFDWKVNMVPIQGVNGYDPDYFEHGINETWHHSAGCSSHCIWGVNLYDFQWMNSSYVLVNHNTPSGNHTSGCVGGTSAGCPSSPGLMNFVLYYVDGAYPADPGSNGGFANSCVYSSYGSYPWCTHNG